MAPGRSEESYGEKIDRCMYNSLIKFASGISIGIVCSALLFKRRPWPMILGAGIGVGMGVSDCNYEFKGKKSALSHVNNTVEHPLYPVDVSYVHERSK